LQIYGMVSFILIQVLGGCARYTSQKNVRKEGGDEANVFLLHNTFLFHAFKIGMHMHMCGFGLSVCAGFT
jgi:hypothetical protein